MIAIFVDAMLVLAAWVVASAVMGYLPRDGVDATGARVPAGKKAALGVAGIVAGVGVVAAVRDLFAADWVLLSLLRDLPWGAVAALAAWSALGRSGALASRRWLGVVVLSVVAGDLLAAMGLSLVEPDARRRARLVLAASGASLIGVTSGASALLLGWGGLPMVALGLLLAAVGAARGGEGPLVERTPGAPLARGSAWGVGLALAAGVLVWLAMVANTTEILAERIEALPLDWPGHARGISFVAGLLGGALGDEGAAALLAREVAARSLSVKGAWAVDAVRAGLAIGGGLPLLVLTRSSLRVGVPLWLVQVLLGVGWVMWMGMGVLP